MEHVSVLELRAEQLVLKHLLLVLVRSDNISTISQLNPLESTRSMQFLQVTRGLLTWAAPRLASLRAMYFLGKWNEVADILSRLKPPQGSGSLIRRWSSTSGTSLAGQRWIYLPQKRHLNQPIKFALFEPPVGEGDKKSVLLL